MSDESTWKARQEPVGIEHMHGIGAEFPPDAPSEVEVCPTCAGNASAVLPCPSCGDTPCSLDEPPEPTNHEKLRDFFFPAESPSHEHCLAYQAARREKREAAEREWQRYVAEDGHFAEMEAADQQCREWAYSHMNANKVVRLMAQQIDADLMAIYGSGPSKTAIAEWVYAKEYTAQFATQPEPEA